MQTLRLTAAQVAGLLVALLGLVVGAGWLFELDAVARALPGSERLGPINPLLFVAAGICLLGAALPVRRPWLDRCTLRAPSPAYLAADRLPVRDSHRSFSRHRRWPEGLRC